MSFREKLERGALKVVDKGLQPWSEENRAARREKREQKRTAKLQRKQEKYVKQQQQPLIEQAQISQENKKEEEEAKKEQNWFKRGMKKSWAYSKKRWNGRGPSSGVAFFIFAGFFAWIFQISYLRWGTTRIADPRWYIINFAIAVFALFYTGVPRKTIFLILLLNGFVFPWASPLLQDWLASMFHTSPSQIVGMAIYFLTLPAVWPLWLLYGMGNSNSRLARRILWVWAIFIAVILTAAMFESFGRNLPTELNNGGAEFRPKTILGGISDLASKIGKGFLGIFTGSKNMLRDELNYATGGLYEAQVEDGQHEPLGVTIDSLMAANPVFFVDEPISLWGTIHGRTIFDPINVSLACWTGDGDSRVYGQVNPKTTEITVEDIKDFECVFPAGSLKKGIHSVVVSAEYPFTTMAYLKTYFIEETRRRNLVREGIDLFSYLGIEDKEPVAIYTNGPVQLSLSFVQSLKGIWSKQSGRSNSVVLSMMISNKWDGMLLNITNLELSLPPSFAKDCSYFTGGKTDEEGRVLYWLPKAIDNNVEEGRIIKCRFNITDPDALLGDSPVSVKYFRLTASYVYHITSSLNVDVYDLPDQPEEGTQEEGTTSSTTSPTTSSVYYANAPGSGGW